MSRSPAMRRDSVSSESSNNSRSPKKREASGLIVVAVDTVDTRSSQGKENVEPSSCKDPCDASCSSSSSSQLSSPKRQREEGDNEQDTIPPKRQKNTRFHPDTMDNWRWADRPLTSQRRPPSPHPHRPSRKFIGDDCAEDSDDEHVDRKSRFRSTRSSSPSPRDEESTPPDSSKSRSFPRDSAKALKPVPCTPPPSPVSSRFASLPPAPPKPVLASSASPRKFKVRDSLAILTPSEMARYTQLVAKLDDETKHAIEQLAQFRCQKAFEYGFNAGVHAQLAAHSLSSVVATPEEKESVQKRFAENTEVQDVEDASPRKKRRPA